MREMKEIDQEYANVCTVLGDTKYKVALLEAKANECLKKLNDLSIESQKLNEAKNEKDKIVSIK